MTAEQYNEAIKQLMTIPGMERTVADDLVLLGIHKISDLEDKDAIRLFTRSNRNAGKTQSQNLLHSFQKAIEYACDLRNASVTSS